MTHKPADAPHANDARQRPHGNAPESKDSEDTVLESLGKAVPAPVLGVLADVPVDAAPDQAAPFDDDEASHGA